MAHEVETMAWAGQVPWHGLGVKVEPSLTPDEMLTVAGCDWTVSKADQFIRVGGQEILTGQKALIRSSDNSILTYVSDGWEPVQNHDAFEFFSDFVKSGHMEMHTAGSLRQGKKVWALARIADLDFDVVANDHIEQYLLFSNPHEYGKCIDIRYTSIRVVCNNTLTMALNGKSDLMVRLNHSKAFDPAIVKQTLSAAQAKNDDYKEACKFLASKTFTNETVEGFFSSLYPGTEEKDSRTKEKLMGILQSQPGAEYGEGSWWQPFNAVTFYTDHVAGRSNDTRLASSWYGVNRNKKLEAFNSAIEFAQAA